MREKPESTQQNCFDFYPIKEQINLQHPLVKLSSLINWSAIEEDCASLFPSKKGRPATPAKLVAGLLYLQHISGLSDEATVWAWVENIYWQYFTGETYLQTKPPVDPSSLTRWRKRLGVQSVEKLLQMTVQAGIASGALTAKQCETVLVDTTVMPKNITHPTDSNLLEKARQALVDAADQMGITLRQNYHRVAPKLVLQISRYAHAKQFKRMNKSLKKLRNIVGRVKRDIERKCYFGGLETPEFFTEVLAKAQRAIEQMPKSKNKLYAWHAPEVECIAKGKARTPYEFGVKVSLASAAKTGFVLCSHAMHGNPYDGHTLEKTVAISQEISGITVKTSVVDRGYKGVEIKDVSILRSGQKRGLTRTIKALIKRRSCIEGTIGHMKNDGRLAKNPLKGSIGDCIHAILCGAGHNLRLLLRYLAHFFAQILGMILFPQNFIVIR